MANGHNHGELVQVSKPNFVEQDFHTELPTVSDKTRAAASTLTGGAGLNNTSRLVPNSHYILQN